MPIDRPLIRPFILVLTHRYMDVDCNLVIQLKYIILERNRTTIYIYFRSLYNFQYLSLVVP